MTKDNLERMLNRVIFNDYWFGAGSEDKSRCILSLCSYYLSDTTPEDIKSEITRLSSQMTNYRTLDKLLDAINDGRNNEFKWEPRFDSPPKEISLSPVFNIQRCEEGSLVAEVETVRSELQKNPVNIATLISYICHQAKESGDL